MLGNIIYPIITAAITAVIGFFLNIFGFKFSELFASYLSDSYLKERIFVVVALIIMVAVIFYDIFSNKLKKAKDELKQKDKDLSKTESDLDITKKAIDNLYDKEARLHAFSALINFKKNDDDKRRS